MHCVALSISEGAKGVELPIQSDSLCSYLYLKLTKKPCYFSYLLCFFFNKTREQEGGTIMYTHVSKGKNDKIKKEVVNELMRTSKRYEKQLLK
jgi:hypothetical protein